MARPLLIFLPLQCYFTELINHFAIGERKRWIKIHHIDLIIWIRRWDSYSRSHLTMIIALGNLILGENQPFYSILDDSFPWLTTSGKALFVFFGKLKRSAHGESTLRRIESQSLETLDLMQVKFDNLIWFDRFNLTAAEFLRE